MDKAAKAVKAVEVAAFKPRLSCQSRFLDTIPSDLSFIIYTD